jgi:hypothetical protein
VADRSPRIVAIVTLALVAPLFASPRAAGAETAIVDGVAPVVGFAIFDFGRSDKLRKKLAQAERRASDAEEAARREHAAFEAEHAARERERALYEREHIAYERERATLAAYRKQSDSQRDGLARLKAQSARARWLARIRKGTPPALLAAVSAPRKHASPSFHPSPKPNAANPHPAARKSHPGGPTSNRSVGWGAI